VDGLPSAVREGDQLDSCIVRIAPLLVGGEEQRLAARKEVRPAMFGFRLSAIQLGQRGDGSSRGGSRKLGLTTLLAAQQMPTIPAPVRVVTVPTLVFSSQNQLIPGLKETDFSVFDNGRLQTALLDTTSMPVSVAIAIQKNSDERLA
jgi:hypothetical protein